MGYPLHSFLILSSECVLTVGIVETLVAAGLSYDEIGELNLI